MAKSTVSETRDYYANMPQWQRDQLMGDAAFESEYRDAMSNVANQAADNPRQIAGLDARETGALTRQNDAATALANGTQANQNALNGTKVASGLGTIMDPRGLQGSMTASGFQKVAGPDPRFNAIAAPTMANTDAMRAKYESGYTDDVVNTTMAGMDREAQRAQLQRDARGAAIGGTSNSRSAVADAVSGQLTGMNKAQMEAQLRDKAFNTAAQYGLQESDMTNQFGLDRASFSADQEAARRAYGLDVSGFALEQEGMRSDNQLALADQDLQRKRAMAENQLALAGFDLDTAMAQAAQGNTAAQLALQKAGLSQDMLNDVYGARTDTAKAQAGLGAEQRDINQQRIDSRYYGGMEAGSWLADVYSGTRTRDAAPYNVSSSGTTNDGKKEASKWQQFAAGAAAGLSSFL